MNKPVEVFIQKPLFGTMCYVRDKFLKEAIQLHTDITVKTKVDGKEYSCTVSPLVWIRDAVANNRKMSKVYLIPEKPMILYGNDLLRYVDKVQEE